MSRSGSYHTGAACSKAAPIPSRSPVISVCNAISSAGKTGSVQEGGTSPRSDRSGEEPHSRPSGHSLHSLIGPMNRALIGHSPSRVISFTLALFNPSNKLNLKNDDISVLHDILLSFQSERSFITSSAP